MTNDRLPDYYEALQISPNADAITVAGVDTIEGGEIILSDDRLLPEPDSLVSQTKAAPKTNSFNKRSQRLIPEPFLKTYGKRLKNSSRLVCE